MAEIVPEPFAWRGRDMGARDDWIFALERGEIAELEAAARAVADRDLAGLSREDFDLPTLDARLRAMRDMVVDGPGFALMRGLPVADWPRGVAARAFWAVGSRIGRAVCQNPQGHLLGHVKDIGADADDPNSRGYQSAANLPFHTDIGAEIVGLFCLRPARSGGLSSVVSAGAVWNEAVRRRPDLAALLTEPYHVDRRGEEAPGQDPYYVMPIFAPAGPRMTVNYIRRFIETGQRHAGAPRLTERHREAMTLMDGIAAEPGIRLDMDFRPGDIQWVNNLVTLHTRTAYEDWPEPERKRHLYRLWLSVPGSWELPPGFHARHGTDPESGRPLGLSLPPGVVPNAPLDVAPAG